MDQFEELHKVLSERLPGLPLREWEPMKGHTTFRVGGPVRLMALPNEAAQLPVLLQAAAELKITPFFLGKGSNLLVSDQGAEAFLIKTTGELEGIREIGPGQIYVGSGVTLARAAVFAAEQGLTGLEFAHGIPGTLGGGIFMNAGAYGGELSQVVDYVDCFTLEGTPVRFAGADLAFGYRTSIFSQRPLLIAGAALHLQPGDPAKIRANMQGLMERRRSKQPLDYPSAGSTFKRPEGHFAGSLIEQCGLKGKRIGGAQVSEKHAGFLINLENATCSDILTLIRFVQETVLRQTGVLLEPEVQLLGCSLQKLP